MQLPIDFYTRSTSPGRRSSGCPHLGMPDDPTTVTLFPSEANYCLRCVHPDAPNATHQATFCLSAGFNACPIRQKAAPRRLPASTRWKRSPADSRKVVLKTTGGILAALLVALFFLLWMPGIVTDLIMSFAPTPASGGSWPTLTPSITPRFSATPLPSTQISTSIGLPVVSTNTPISIRTKTPISIVEMIVHVTRPDIFLRSSPTKYYTLIQPLGMNEDLYLLGRSSDNTWLYIHTYEGTKGWVQANLFDLNPKAIVYLPVIAPPPTPRPQDLIRPSATPTET